MSRLAKQRPSTFQFGYIDKRTNERRGPQPKQALAHTSRAEILFYGGAAFGGKSEYQVVDALTVALEYEGSSQAIFRRTHKELKQHIVGRLMKLAPPWLGTLNSTDMVFKLFNGSEIWLCHAIHESSVYQYQSNEWIVLRIDEASHFTEFQVKYLMTRVRTSTPGWWPRVRLTSNPGNVGHGWLKRWFVRPSPEALGNRTMPAPGEVWTPQPTEDDPEPMSRTFIPAYSVDNPAGIDADPRYMSRIRQLGGDKAKQLEHGDWDANDSMIVGGTWKENHRVTAQDVALLHNVEHLRPGMLIPWHVIPQRAGKPPWRPGKHATVYGSVDYGYGAPWAFHLTAVLPGGHMRTFFEFYQARVKDSDQAKKIRVAIERMVAAGEMALPDWILLEPIMWNSRAETSSKSIAEVYNDELGIPLGVALRQGAAGRPARMSRPNRWLDALATAPDGLPWWTVTTGCPHLIRTVPEVPWDEDDPEVEDPDSENHCYEGVGRLFESRPELPRRQDVDRYVDLDPISKAHHEARDKRHGIGQKKKPWAGI